jgi:hypothetical protein
VSMLPAVAHLDGSPVMRAKRAQTQALEGREIIAPGKRSAARGYEGKMLSSFFPSGLARRSRAKPEGKKDGAWGGFLPKAAALRRATIMPPLRGSGKANKRCGVDAGSGSLFAFWCHCPGATHRDRSLQSP